MINEFERGIANSRPSLENTQDSAEEPVPRKKPCDERTWPVQVNSFEYNGCKLQFLIRQDFFNNTAGSVTPNSNKMLPDGEFATVVFSSGVNGTAWMYAGDVLNKDECRITHNENLEIGFIQTVRKQYFNAYYLKNDQKKYKVIIENKRDATKDASLPWYSKVSYISYPWTRRPKIPFLMDAPAVELLKYRDGRTLAEIELGGQYNIWFAIRDKRKGNISKSLVYLYNWKVGFRSVWKLNTTDLRNISFSDFKTKSYELFYISCGTGKGHSEPIFSGKTANQALIDEIKKM